MKHESIIVVYDSCQAIAEEIADVRIMLEQIEYLFGIDITVNAQMDNKLNRQLKRMKEERR